MQFVILPAPAEVTCLKGAVWNGVTDLSLDEAYQQSHV
jgi:hypothetical protein